MNELILRLTDREQTGGVTYPGAAYFPPPPRDESRVREVLGLSDPTDPLTVLVLSQLVMSCSWLYGQLGEQVETHSHRVSDVELFSMSSGDLLPVDGETPGVRRTARHLPLRRELVVDQGNGVLTVTLSGSWTAPAPYTPAGPGLWDVDWPEESGIHGQLQDPTFPLIITHRPYQVDWGSIQADLKNQAQYLSPVLSRTGLYRNFFQAQDSVEAVASACAALALANDDIAWDRS